MSRIFCGKAKHETRVVGAPRGGICEEGTHMVCTILGIELKK